MASENASVPAQPPPPELPVDIPFLEGVLNKHYRTNAKILDVKCEIIGEGKGFMSIMTKVTPSYDSPKDLPVAVVIKNVTDAKIRQGHAEEMKKAFDSDPNLLSKLHTIELNAYKFFNEDGPPPFPVPTFIYGQPITDKQPGLAILEFVGGKSLTFNDDNSVEEMEHLIKHIASIQAYGIKKGNAIDTYFNTKIFERFVDLFNKGVEQYPLVKAGDPDMFWFPLEKVKELTDSVRQDFADVIRGKFPYRVIVLGDTQPNNVLWKIDKNGDRLNEVAAFVDFQVCRPGRCTHDLANMMIWGLPPEIREKEQDRLIELYHADLVNKSGGNAPISVDEAKKELRREMITYAVIFCPFICSLQNASLRKMIGMSDERMNQMKRRIASVFGEHIQK